MASIKQLREEIDLIDLAQKLGLEQPGGKGNYRSPHHADTNPSLVINASTKGQHYWKDWSADVGGSCIDLVMYVEGLSDVRDAVIRLHELYSIDLDDRPAQRKQGIDLWADNYVNQVEKAREYLNGRCITDEVIDRCAKRGTIGYTDYVNPKYPAGDKFHGGPAPAFIVRGVDDDGVRGIDYRYIDPELNGGLKTKSQGEKVGSPYIPDRISLKNAEIVYIVESPINALSIESCKIAKRSAIATRGTARMSIDWHFLAGKLAICCMDNDKPIEAGPKKGERPGATAAWRIHEELTALNIPCLFVDQDDESWSEINDINDFLVEKGIVETKIALKRFETWLVPGLPGYEAEATRAVGKRRVYLPTHDYTKYWMYRVKLDFTMSVKLVKNTDADGNENSHKEFEDLCGFRIACISRITIASATAAMSGEKDNSPHTIFSASVQTPRHGNTLLRKVFTDEQLHNPDQWKKLGPIFKPAQFSRMLNLLERTTHIGAREAVNFVGLAWKNGRPIVNEGSDTYFTEPDKQCPYSKLSFPSGPVYEAKKILTAYQDTFKHNAAAQLAVWGLGSHLKAFLGFWPHLNMQADKGSGKSTLIKRLERSIGFTMFSAQSLQTEFRLLTSVSHTSHPVGWEEISTRRQDVIDKAVAMLQESYQHTITRRGSDMTEYLMCAPVLLAGEDVPVDGLTGKLVRVELKEKGTLLSETLPVFPVRQWLEYLASLTKQTVLERYETALVRCQSLSSVDNSDAGGQRMVGNYAAVLTAWALLCDFSNLPDTAGGFTGDLIAQMNGHIMETKPKREPWVWILEIIFGQMDAGLFMFPWKVEQDSATKEIFIYLRCTHLMQYLSSTSSLKEKFNALTIKSPQVLKKQLNKAGVIVADDKERTILTRRVAHMQVLSLTVLKGYGLTLSLPEILEQCSEQYKVEWDQLALVG